MTAARWGFVSRNYTADATRDLGALRGVPVLLALAGQDLNVDTADTERGYRAALDPGGALTVRHYPDAAHSMVRKSVEDSGPRLALTALLAPRALFADGLLDDQRRFLADPAPRAAVRPQVPSGQAGGRSYVRARPPVSVLSRLSDLSGKLRQPRSPSRTGALDRVTVRTPKEIVLSRTSRKHRTGRTSTGKTARKGRKHRRVNLTPRPVTPAARRKDRAAGTQPGAEGAAAAGIAQEAQAAPTAEVTTKVRAAPQAEDTPGDEAAAAGGVASADTVPGTAALEGLSRNAQRTLSCLYGSGAHGATPEDLGEAVGYTARTVAKHLDGLARNGLVVRQADGRWCAVGPQPGSPDHGPRLPAQDSAQSRAHDPARDGLRSGA
ncbi:hypothetical protein [Streptomyces candidus]|uniref:DNA-binding transcriptional ArsR family regulator n=1 Tax=Streptomyces candidus TaxID=67283 RepID=A0A7X0LNS4_9ACTN|nr:hypothetical protein [Streptomyces candidus]MBB6435793.1 DNA-binding transcriptional ArsR family regulator [Streptomyces candidus]